MRIPSREVPQADTLRDVLRVPLAVERGASTFQDIGNFIGKVDRQGRYYRLAAEILGLINNHANHATLTDRGRAFLHASPSESANIIRQAVFGTRLIQRVLPYLETRGEVTKSQMREFIVQVTEPAGPTMIPRRVSTVLSWLQDLGEMERVGLRYRLNRQPRQTEANDLPQFPDDEPIAPSSTQLSEYQTVEERTNRAGNTISYLRDQAAMDRANAEHRRLTNLAASKLRASGLIPRCNGMIDLATRDADRAFIFEMKSVTQENERHQVRDGVGQLYEYQYLQHLPDAVLVLVLSEKLTSASAWMREYLESARQIHLVWDGNSRFYASDQTRQSLPFFWS